jgi:hypothetical protein
MKTFGVPELPHGMFYAFENALRFDLEIAESDTYRPMRQFSLAYERADTIAQEFFANSSDVYVLFSSYGLEKPRKRRLRHTEFCGIERSAVQHISMTAQQDEDHIAAFGSDVFRHWDMAKLSDKQSIADIVWLGVASEMEIRPAFYDSTEAYLVDVSNGLLLHVYDDRGMDVAATSNARLSGLFARHKDWLLDYDRPLMNSRFAQAG